MINIKSKSSILSNFLILIFLVHFRYGVVFISSINGHFELGLSLINRSWNELRNYYWSDSPLFNIFQTIFKINEFENFVVLIYLSTLLFLFLIAIKIAEIGKLSLAFILSGWLISVSWFFGLVDALLVYLIVSIFVDIIKNNKFSLKIGVLNSFLVFNHFAIGIFINFILFSVWKEKKIHKVLAIFTSFSVGIGLNLLYKLIIEFNGETRLHYLLGPKVIPNLYEAFPEMLRFVLFSGFYGSLPLVLYFLNKNFYINAKKITLPLTIAILGASLAKDASRIFSYLIIPVILIILFELNSYFNTTNDKLVGSLLLCSILIVIVIDEYWVLGPNIIFDGKSTGGFSKLIYEILLNKINYFK